MSFTFGESAVSLAAGADLTAAQYLAVKVDSATGGVVLCGVGEDGIGVLLNKPAAGEAASVCVGATGCKWKVENHAGIGYGSSLMAGATGGAVLAAGAGNFVLAKALQDPGANGEIISVLLHKVGAL